MLEMKKRVLSILCSFSILCGIVLSVSINTTAESENRPEIIVDGSVLMQDDYSKGTSVNSLLRGKHLMEGECCVSKAGIGRIYVYGQTTADHVVDYVAVLMYVERLDESDEKWGHVEGYVADARDTYYVNVDDTLKVDRGYYYRVHCDHIAGNDDERPYDEAISYTDGIWIP